MLNIQDYNTGMIYTEVKNCIDCSKCIHECPVLKSNVSVPEDGGYKVCVDEKECILCGRCIDTCSHDVRHYKDDFDAFLTDLQNGKKFTMLVAPAFHLIYPDEYLRIMGYLKSLGVVNFYPVSFGADIAVWGYLKYIESCDVEGLISQPCPSVVNYVEKHLPQLVPNLIPVQSPMMCTAIYLKKYKKIQEDLVFLSPCVAKKLEIESKRGLGLVQHNITFKSLINHIKSKNIDISTYPQAKEEIDYGLGSVLPSPGGLMENIKYYTRPQSAIVQVEGETKAYKYLREYAARQSSEHIPILVDILNCSKGCCYGTGVENRNDSLGDKTAHAIFNMQKNKQVRELRPEERIEILNVKFKNLKLQDFICEYDTNAACVTTPVPEEEIEQILTQRLLKLSDIDQHVDCAACGYLTCRQMAEAIALGINRHDNCVYYVKNSLADTLEKLRHTEKMTRERLQSMLDSSPLLCAVLDENAQVLEVNKAANKLFGPSGVELYKNRFFDICPPNQPCGTPTRKKVLSLIEPMLKYGSLHLEWMHQTPEGEPIPCEVFLKRISLSDKTVAFAYVRDLRKQKQMMDELEAAINQAKAVELVEESNRAKTRFLARMSHEIRTPITAMLGISEIQLQNPSLPPLIEESFSKIFSSANLLLGIVNDILDLSKIEAGKMGLLQSEYDLASIINDVAQLHLATLENDKIKFRLKIDENLPAYLIGDALRIEQILNNLLSNAFKYTERGEVKLSISCKKKKKDTIIVLTISDTGMGMTPEQVSEIYNEYTRFHDDENRHISGAGLGMPIVYSLASLMNAKLKIKSKPGKGTTVSIEIPQKVVGDSVLGAATARSLQNFQECIVVKKRTFTPTPMPYGKVLVVDDVEANLYVICGLLAFYDLKVETCVDGFEALKKIEKGNVYDVVFMYHMMPGINGTDTMRKMREIGYTHPVIALTANALIGESEKFIKSGFDAFISKPINTKHLNSALVKYIRDKQPAHVIKEAEKTKQNNDIHDFQSNAEVQIKLRSDFAREHKNTATVIREALDNNDISTALHTTHNLKSLAGIINEKDLSRASEHMEQLLKAGEKPTHEQLSMLEHRLKIVLDKISSAILYQHPSGGISDMEKIREVFGRLLPLLESRNSDSQNLIPELKEIPETAVLIRQIENFALKEAAKTLLVLKDVMEI